MRDNIYNHKVQKNVSVRYNALNENTRLTTISAKHFGIIRELENATNEEISNACQRYLQYESENTKIMMKIKRKLGIKQRL